MAALVQAFPQQAGTITMLQTRPSSASGSYQPTPPPQAYQTNSRQVARNLYNHGGISVGSSGYRGTTVSPIAPYAFTATPGLGPNNASLSNQSLPHLRQEHRTNSAPSVPYSHTDANRNRYSTAGSSTSSSSSQNVQHQHSRSQDDSYVTSTAQRSFDQNARPVSMLDLAAPNFPQGPVTKSTPDRYRRAHRRVDTATASTTPQRITSPSGSASPSGSGMATVSHLYNPPTMTRGSSSDDMALYRQPSSDRDRSARRRSIGNFNFTAPNISPWDPAATQHSVLPDPPQASAQFDKFTRTSSSPILRPTTTHGRTASHESNSSSRSSSEAPPIKRDGSSSGSASNATTQQLQSVAKNEPRVANVPPRGSSDVTKRTITPSPLSQAAQLGPSSPVQNLHHSSVPPINISEESLSSHDQLDSPAVQQLAALGEKDGKKKKSRLRRAFSFGSAAELRRASGEGTAAREATADRVKLKNDRYADEEEAEQAAIAQKQEKSGLGESIYSKGQGRFFSGSTDNLSISSTASSASIMIRKMGKGMKKSTRSLVGLFRPKSVTGVPPADPLPASTLAQVSMVTVEAEREKVNVNANPHEQVGGGTGFPKLERNSLDAANAAGAGESSGSFVVERGSSERSRRSIVGGERERAEVLAAVKKGILKRTDSGNSSPISKPVDGKAMDFSLPVIPHISDSPRSTPSSTPGDEHPPRSGHRRTDSVTIEGEDYFLSMPKIHTGDSKSAPNTPNGTLRNIHFSPRIQFHDTWPSQEYDRRGEIATCNRLTPMLAQQIKEELNTFKMEMEVHEQSKVYTHFF